MLRFLSEPRAKPIDSHLARLLWQWLALGVLLFTVVPAARGYSIAVGWLWYWLIAAPAIALCVVYRQRLWLQLRHLTSQRTAAPIMTRMPAQPQARRVPAGRRNQRWLRAAGVRCMVARFSMAAPVVGAMLWL